MRKKLILFSATLTGVLLLMLAYRLSVSELDEEPAPTVSEATTASDDKESSKEIETLDVGPAGFGEAKKGHFTTLKDGRVIREFGFDQRLGSEDQNTLVLSKPWVAFYGKDGRVIYITASRASVPIEGDAGQIRTPKRGSLEEQVNIAIFYRDPDSPRQDEGPPEPTAEQVEWRIEMEHVDFETEFSRLSSPGAVRVHSEQFQMAGRDLTMQYDQINQRLQELELRHLDQFVLRRENGATPLGSGERAKPKPATAGDETKKASKKQNAPYRMTLSQDVVLEQGDDVLRADRIEILVDDAFSGSGRQRSGGGGKVSQPKTETALAVSTVRLSAQGPLRITAAEDAVSGADAERMIFTAYGAPVDFSQDGQSVMQAGQLVYDRAERLITMTGSAEQPVRLTMSDQQWITADQQVQVDEATGRAMLTGPGVVTYASSDEATPAKVQYKDQLAVKFAAADADRGSGFRIEWRQVEALEFQGQLLVETSDGSIIADEGQLTFYPAASANDSKSDTHLAQRAALRSLELTGHVNARGEQNHFSANHVTADFVAGEDGSSQVSRILAEGDVEIEDPNYQIQAGDNLELLFPVGMKAAETAEATSSTEPGTKSKFGFDQLLSSSRPEHVLANGAGGRVKLWDKQREVHVAGDRIEGNAITDVWTIMGQPAIVEMVKEGTLQGPRIHMDRGRSLCEVDGGGEIVAGSSTDLTGSELETPLPLTIRWTRRAIYHMAGDQIQFEGVTARVERRQKTKQMVNVLSCEQLMVTLAEAGGKADAANDVTSGRDFSRLSAFGPDGSVVRVRTVEKDVSGKLLTSSVLQARQVDYDHPRKEMRALGGGWLDYANYQKQENSSEKKEDVGLTGRMDNLIASGDPSYTLIRFGKSMTYRRDDATVHFEGGAAVDHLPIPSSADLPTGLAMLETEGLRRLDCDELFIANEALAMRSDSFQNQQWELVRAAGEGMADMPQEPATHQASTANGNIFFEAVVNGRHHTFSGETWIYESDANVVTMTGSIAMPVYLDQMSFLRVRCHFDDKGVRLFDALPYGQSEISLGAY